MLNNHTQKSYGKTNETKENHSVSIITQSSLFGSAIIIWGPVHTTSEKRRFISTLPSTLIRHKYGAFRKRSSNRRILETPALRLNVDGKHFGNEAFQKRLRYDNHAISLPARLFLKHKSKMTGDCCIFKFLWRSVDGKDFMRFQSENAVFKFLRCSVDGAWDPQCSPEFVRQQTKM